MISFLKSHNTKYLLLFSSFCCVLIIVRIYVVKNDTFLFLIKNLALAWVPYLLSQFFVVKSKYLRFLIVLCTIIYFPNSLYMITDLFQLWPKNHVSVWFELIHLFSFAMVSLFLGFGTLKNFENNILIRYKSRFVNIYIFLIIYLGSFGVYFGRFVRLNSSDILLHPKNLFIEMFKVFSDPFKDVNFYGTTFVFAVFIYLIYYGVFHFSKNHK
jgi:uncharacterized membrane protein